VVRADLPFGKKHLSHASITELYPRAMREFRRVLRPRSGRSLRIANALRVALR
jgi:hypothetical protein